MAKEIIFFRRNKEIKLMMKNFGCMAQSFGLVVTRQHEIHNRLVTVFLMYRQLLSIFSRQRHIAPDS
ncbi:hypothetical protein DW788_09950 [Bifidobacterium longum]|nr:hypothetical protein DW788_09950 [Bifidobacterium longum]RHM00494.1 hypothetical protein DWZ85_03185 [Bifidobacterium longum]